MLLLAAPSARHSRSSTEGQFHPLVKSAWSTAFHLNQETPAAGAGCSAAGGPPPPKRRHGAAHPHIATPFWGIDPEALVASRGELGGAGSIEQCSVMDGVEVRSGVRLDGVLKRLRRLVG